MFCYRKVAPGRGAHPSKEHFSKQRALNQVIATRSFFIDAAVAAFGRRITLRTWSSIVSHDGRRIQEADRLCLKIPDRDRTSLFVNSTKRLSPLFSPSVSFRQFLLGASFYAFVRPQTALLSTITRQACTAYGFSTPTEMGTTPQRLRL